MTDQRAIWMIRMGILAAGTALLFYLRLFEPINSLLADCLIVGFATACSLWFWEWVPGTMRTPSEEHPVTSWRDTGRDNSNRRLL